MRLQIGVSTLASESIAYDGVDWESKHRQQVKEQRARQDDGLVQAEPEPNEAPRFDRVDDAQAVASEPAVINVHLSPLPSTSRRPR